MPKDDLEEPLIKKKSAMSRFVRWAKKATAVGMSGKDIYAKTKNYSAATQSKGERAFATLAQGASYLDKACYFFPPAKIFTSPVASVLGNINTVLELKALINLIGTGQVTPLLLESKLFALREFLLAEIIEQLGGDSESHSTAEENKLIVGIDGLIAFIQQKDEQEPL